MFQVPEVIETIEIGKNRTHSAIDMPEMHTHSYYELYFLLSGERRYFIGHTIYDVSPGDVVVIPRNTLHRTTVRNSKGYERYVVYFSESYAKEMKNKLGINEFNHFMQASCIQLLPEWAEKVRYTLEEMKQEITRKEKYSDIMLQNLFHYIIIILLRHGRNKQKENGREVGKIQDVAKYISENYSSVITLSSAAKMAYMENTYFSKKFKRLTGFGFHEYLVQTRIKAAERLLVHSNLTISEVSERCGFSSSNYFGDVFRNWNRIAPSEYRKKMKNQ